MESPVRPSAQKSDVDLDGAPWAINARFRPRMPSVALPLTSKTENAFPRKSRLAPADTILIRTTDASPKRSPHAPVAPI